MDQVVKKQVTMSATPEQVWEALTNPKLTKKFFFNSEVHSDWKVGSPITFTRKFLFFTFKLEGEIKKIEPQKLLQYTLMKYKLFGKSDPNNYSTVTDTLVYQNGKTTLSITDDVGSYPGAQNRYDRSVKGWDKILSGLKDLVEHNSQN